MTCNVGGVDRTVRILVGIVFTGAAFYAFPSAVTAGSFLVIAGLSFASAWYGFCFVNKFFGINTAKSKPAMATSGRG